MNIIRIHCKDEAFAASLPDLFGLRADVERFSIEVPSEVASVLGAGAPVFVGVSGGRDSQALARAAKINARPQPVSSGDRTVRALAGEPAPLAPGRDRMIRPSRSARKAAMRSAAGTTAQAGQADTGARPIPAEKSSTTAMV